MCSVEAFVHVRDKEHALIDKPVLQSQSQTGVDTGLCLGALYPHAVPNQPQDRGQAVHRGSHALSAAAGLAPFQLTWGCPFRWCAPLHHCSCPFSAVQLTHVLTYLVLTPASSCLCHLACLSVPLSQALLTHAYVLAACKSTLP